MEATREGGRLLWRLDGRLVDADAVKVGEDTYSILLGGHAFEVSVHESQDGLRVHAGGQEFSAVIVDPRAWQGRHGHAVEVEGKLQVLAPMPGKIVRLLVAQGETVQAGQGIVVVEAMKMQNEVRSAKSGRIEKLLVAEGKTVNAGEVVAVVT